jgi:hypothetical protein
MSTTKTHGTLSRLLAGSALAASLLLGTGCILVAAGAAAGAGTVAYIRGELDAPVDGGLDATDHAANRTIEQLQFVKVSETRDALSADITARTGEDKKVEIILTNIGNNLTKVQVRIGIFGDEMISRAVLDHIKSNL